MKIFKRNNFALNGMISLMDIIRFKYEYQRWSISLKQTMCSLDGKFCLRNEFLLP